MPTFGDLLAALGQGAIAQHNTATRGPNWRTQDRAAAVNEQEAAIREAIAIAAALKSQAATGASAELAVSEMPELAGRTAEEAAAAYAAREAAKDKDVSRRKTEQDILTSSAKAAESENKSRRLDDVTKASVALKEAQARLADSRATGDMTAYQEALIESKAADRRVREAMAAAGITWVPGVDAEGNAGRVAVPRRAPVGSFIGGPGTAAEQNRGEMANVAGQAGASVLKSLDNPEVARVIGPLAGRYESWHAAFGSGDPAFKSLQTELRALAQVLTGIHNLRSAAAGKALEDVLSTTNSVEALQGAIKGALIVVDAFKAEKARRGSAGGLRIPGQPAMPPAAAPGATAAPAADPLDALLSDYGYPPKQEE